MMFLKPELMRGSAANSAVRVGLLGCGGRGRKTRPTRGYGRARAWSLSRTCFKDQLDKALRISTKCKDEGFSAAGRPATLPSDPKLTNRSPLKRVDAVVIATPRIFIPQHLETAVAAGNMSIARAVWSWCFPRRSGPSNR